MSIIRARQPAITRVTPHQGNPRWIVPRRRLVGAQPAGPAINWGGDSVLQRTLSVIPDGEDCTCSFWLRYTDPPPGVNESIYQSATLTGGGIGFEFFHGSGTNRTQLTINSTTGALSLQYRILDSVFPRGQAINVTFNYASNASLSGFAGTSELYLDGVVQGIATTNAGTNVRWDRALYALGADALDAVVRDPLFADMTQFWLDDTFVDLKSGGIDKFYQGPLALADLGVNGELPTGSPPRIFMGVPMLANTGGVDNTGWNGGSNQADNNFDFTLTGPGVSDVVETS